MAGINRTKDFSVSKVRAVGETKPVYLPALLIAICLVGAIAIWWISLSFFNLDRINDLGLISAMPLTIFLALLLLSMSFGIVLKQERIWYPAIVLHLVILVFMLYGTAAIVENAPRTAVAWKLVGLINFIRETGTVSPLTDAFNNWPGFFILVAFLTEAMGLQNPLLLAKWSPVILNLLYMGPLIMIFRSGTHNRRHVWLGVWFFYLANWIGQDYLSPQGFNYFLYLVILGILLTWFRSTPVQNPWYYPLLNSRPLKGMRDKANQVLTRSLVADQPSQPWQRVILLAILVVIFIVIVPSHQLTPFAIMISVSALIFFNRLTPRSLPILMAVLTASWIIYMSVPYLAGHLDNVLGPLGSLGENISANLTARVRGSPDHELIIQMRIIYSALLIFTAILGGIRQFFNKQIEIGNFILLAIMPFTLLSLQVYGGELLMRSYLFSLPFLAFLSAGLFVPGGPSRILSLKTPLVIGFTSLVLAVGFFFARYGNERMDYFTPQEIAAVNLLHDIAEPNSQLVAVTDFLPWRAQDYTSLKYETIQRMAKYGDLDGIAGLMNDKRYSNSYLILTPSQQASVELYFGWAPGVWENFEKAMLTSSQFELVTKLGDSLIFTSTKER